MDKREKSLFIIQMRQKVFFHMLLYNRVECQCDKGTEPEPAFLFALFSSFVLLQSATGIQNSSKIPGLQPFLNHITLLRTLCSYCEKLVRQRGPHTPQKMLKLRSCIIFV